MINLVKKWSASEKTSIWKKINLKTFLIILFLNYSKDIGVMFTKQGTNQTLNISGGK